jgi:hypothetical protein
VLAKKEPRADIAAQIVDVTNRLIASNPEADPTAISNIVDARAKTFNPAGGKSLMNYVLRWFNQDLNRKQAKTAGNVPLAESDAGEQKATATTGAAARFEELIAQMTDLTPEEITAAGQRFDGVKVDNPAALKSFQKKVKAYGITPAELLNPEIRLSRSPVTPEQDKAYLAAVAKGDTATAQRMVDEAVKRAGEWGGGISPVVYHGSPHDPFNKFKIPSKGFNSTVFGSYEVSRNAAFFTPDKNAATSFMTQGGRTSGSTRAFRVVGEMLDWRKGITNAQFNSLVGDGVNPRWLSQKGASWELFDQEQDPDGALIKAVTKMGYDGVIIHDTDGTKDFDSYVVFDPSQIKSADAITRDDSGRVIPLSERFNEKSPDIWFSRAQGELTDESSQAGAVNPLSYKSGRNDPLDRSGRKEGRLDLNSILRIRDDGKREGADTRAISEVRFSHSAEPLTPPTTDPELRALYLKLWEAKEGDRTIGKDEQLAIGRKWIKDQGGVDKVLQLAAAGEIPRGWKGNAVTQIMLSNPAVRAKWDSGDKASRALILNTMALYMDEASEQGRDLQALKVQGDILAMQTPEGRRNLLYQLLIAATPQEMQMLKNASTDAKVANRKERVARGLALADKLGLTSVSDADLMDLTRFYAILNDISMTRSDRMDKVLEYWRNSILSGPQTNIVNAVGTGLFDMLELFVQRPMEAMLAGAIKATPLSRIKGLREAAEAAPTRQSLAAMRAAILPAFGKARQTFSDVFNAERHISPGNKADVKGPAIAGMKGRIIRIPQRAMLAVDEFLKTMLQAGLVADYAYRAGTQLGLTGPKLDAHVQSETTDIASDSWTKAIDESRRLTFAERSGPFAQSVNTLRQRYRGLTFVMPFVTTPMNIMSTGFRKTPLGAITMAWKSTHGGYVGKQDQAIRDMTEQVAAWIVAGTLYGLTGSGDDDDTLITGSPFTSPKERDIKASFYPPQSIRIGGQWVSYSRFEPFATMLTAMIDGIRALKQGAAGRTEDAVSTLMASAKSAIRDKTFLQGIANIMTAIDSADRTPDRIAKVIEEFTASWMPNIVRQPLRQMDPFVRDTRPKAGTTMAQETMRRIIPAAGIAAPPRLNLMGKPIAKGRTALSRIFIPARTQPDQRMSRIEQTLTNYNNALTDPEKRWWPDITPIDTMKVHGDKREMNEAQYEQYVKMRGELAWNMLKNTYTNVNNPSEYDIKRIRNAFNLAGKTARTRLRDVLK